mgnify:CR=1 FL=1
MRDGDEKLLVGKDPKQIELFRFPADSVEKTNLSPRSPAEVARLKSLLDAWTASLPQQPDPECLSSRR